MKMLLFVDGIYLDWSGAMTCFPNICVYATVVSACHKVSDVDRSVQS